MGSRDAPALPRTFGQGPSRGRGVGWGGRRGVPAGRSVPSRQHVLQSPEWVITSSFLRLVSLSLVDLVLHTPRE